MRRLVLLLAASEGAASLGDRVKEYVASVAPRAAAAGADVRGGHQIESDPLAALAEATGRNVAPLNALVEVTAADLGDDALAAIVDGAAAALADVIDPRRSTAVLGEVHKLTSHGPGVLELALAARRISSLTPDGFNDYWLNTHAPLALSLMPPGSTDRFGYQQLHADAKANQLAAEAAGVAFGDYDGLLQVHMTAPEDFLSVAAEPSFAQKIYEDELNFADQGELRGAFLHMAG